MGSYFPFLYKSGVKDRIVGENLRFLFWEEIPIFHFGTKVSIFIIYFPYKPCFPKKEK